MYNLLSNVKNVNKISEGKGFYFIMKRIVMFILTIVVILICREGHTDSLEYIDTENVSDCVLRFHIMANSDTKADQRLKLMVKDVVSKRAAEDMKNAGICCKEDAVAYINENMNTYTTEAKKVVAENGYSYNVTADIGKSWFPVKIYGKYIFPEGEYDAVQMKIGEGAGRNWWCVLFPSLCIVDEAYQVMPEENDSEENEDEEYKIKFRIVEWIKDMW